MIITPYPDQETRIRTRVAGDDFPSVAEAACQLINEALAERAFAEGDDLEWATSLVDEALAEVERGEVITLEEHEARNDARLPAMK